MASDYRYTRLQLFLLNHPIGFHPRLASGNPTPEDLFYPEEALVLVYR